MPDVERLMRKACTDKDLLAKFQVPKKKCSPGYMGNAIIYAFLSKWQDESEKKDQNAG